MPTVRVQQNTINVRVGQENVKKVISAGSGAGGGAGTLNSLNDVDTTSLSTGSVLVYDNSVEKWVSTLIMTPGENTQNLEISGGVF